METVFRNAIRLSKDPAIALRARQKDVMSFGMYGYALLCEGIDFAARDSRILGTVADVAFSRDDETALYTLEPLLSRNPADKVYRFALEFAFAAYQTLSRDVYSRSFGFSCLRAACAAPHAFVRWTGKSPADFRGG